jgi:putative membrane protein
MALGMLLFVGVLIVGLIVLLRYLGQRRNVGSEQSSAERWLAERYARGEIDEQEYRQRLQVLRGGGAA